MSQSDRKKDGAKAEFVSLDSDHPFAKSFRAGYFPLERGEDIPDTTDKDRKPLLDPRLFELVNSALQGEFESQEFEAWVAGKNEVDIFQSRDPSKLVWDRLPKCLEWILKQAPLSNLLKPEILSSDRSKLAAVLQDAIRRIPSAREIKTRIGYSDKLRPPPPTRFVENGPEWCRFCMATQLAADFMRRRSLAFARVIVAALPATDEVREQVAAPSEIEENGETTAETEPSREGRERKRGPKKGPRKESIVRRSAIKLCKRQGLKGLEAAKFLDAHKVRLQPGRVRDIYETWEIWYDHDPKAFQKQFWADSNRR